MNSVFFPKIVIQRSFVKHTILSRNNYYLIWATSAPCNYIYPPTCTRVIFMGLGVHYLQDYELLVGRNKPYLPRSFHLGVCNTFLTNICPTKMFQIFFFFFREDWFIDGSNSKSWTWLHLILLLHCLPSSPSYSLLIERCNSCCPLSSTWFNVTSMINVLLNLLPLSLITMLKKIEPTTKCHYQKCHISLPLFTLL